MRRRDVILGLLAAGPEAGLPDFSRAGYRGGRAALPRVEAAVELRPEAGDQTARIQAALDRVRAGAVLLRRGEWVVGGTLRIVRSGIVLRGEAGTTLLAAGKEPRTLIEIRGGAGVAGEGTRILDEVVPVGARRFRVAAPRGLRPGQTVLVRRAGNAAWIREIGMDRIAERPGVPGSTRQWTPFDLDFERSIVAVDGEWVTVDAPVLCAIEQRWGGGWLLPFDDRARLRECGVEDLRAVSAFDRDVRATYRGETYLADEAHARSFVAIDGANDCWVRGARAEGFSYACVDVRRTRGVTVADSYCGAMVSQLTGSRRYPFSVNGQRTLVVRCEADTGRHDFVVGSRVAGPNVFLDCRSGRQYATSEPHHRWSVGGLYDNVRSAISVQDRGYMGTGHGWSGANYVLWNCEGRVVCHRPPTADNWVIGHIGERAAGAFPGRPDGRFLEWGRHVAPRSLYEWQLRADAK